MPLESEHAALSLCSLFATFWGGRGRLIFVVTCALKTGQVVNRSQSSVTKWCYLFLSLTQPRPPLCPFPLCVHNEFKKRQQQKQKKKKKCRSFVSSSPISYALLPSFRFRLPPPPKKKLELKGSIRYKTCRRIAWVFRFCFFKSRFDSKAFFVVWN